MNSAPPSPASARDRPIAAWGWPLIVLRLVLMLSSLLVFAPLYYAVAPFHPHNPVPRWFLRLVALLSGTTIRIRGPRPSGRTFILANHVSWLDIPAIAGITGSAFIAHDGLATIRPLRWLCSLNDTVFVARHDRRSIAAQVTQVRIALQETGALTIFPEGTTSDGSRLLPFKSSLLSALDSDAEHIPVQPLWLDYGRSTADIAWVGQEPGLDNALRVLARWRPIDLTMTFLPPLTGEQRSDRKTIAQAARNAIASEMRARTGHCPVADQ